MFDINRKLPTTFFWPVVIAIPVDGELGKYEELKFQAEFKRLDRDQVTALEKSCSTDVQMAHELVAGWRDVMAGTEPVPFSAEAFNVVLNIPQAPSSVIKAFYDSLTGRLRGN